ncbi:MAG: Gfo/Idh/MocA family oxidoreductase [Candidatus Bathyarchaeota archaeon]|nr:MAG: Gfo/Idh/MocA family oxidoreductase [Candidatus Bathyarchaeota archaeon]
MKKIGIGIIGLGYIGKLHMRHSLKLPNVNLVGVADFSKKAQKEAKSFGVKKIFSNYEQLLKEPEIDAVIVALPTHLHLQCARDVAEAGKHVFLEKPIARSVEEGKKILSYVQKNSVKLMMGYQLRFNKVFRDLKDKIDDGTLGDVELVYATFISSGPFFHRADSHTPLRVPEWWFNKELTGGGALIDVGSHLINLLRWYFGEITNVKCHLGYRYNLDFEDGATCFAKFDSGTTAVISAGWFSQAFNLGVDCYGSVNHAFAKHRSPNRLIAATQMLTTGMSDFHRPHFDELNYFARSLLADIRPTPSGNDGLKDLEVISWAYQNSMGLD